MICPQCGFNHEGWGFEPGYEKQCVKCSFVLAPPDESELSEDADAARAGFFRRILGRLFGRKRKGEVAGDRGAYAIPKPTPPLEAPQLSIPEEASCPQEEPICGEALAAPLCPTVIEPIEEARDIWMESCASVLSPQHEDAVACERSDSARLLADGGQCEEAISLLEKSVETSPDDAAAWVELGRLHYTYTRDFARSIACSNQALALNDKLVQAHCNLCLAQLQQGQFDVARKGLLRVIRLVEKSKDSQEQFQQNTKVLLHDCLSDLYNAKRQASGELHEKIADVIELLELEKICFH
jgi:tetratricopeptide (TPR) repeat protein